jgi:hypothetical protein
MTIWDYVTGERIARLPDHPKKESLEVWNPTTSGPGDLYFPVLRIAADEADGRVALVHYDLEKAKTIGEVELSIKGVPTAASGQQPTAISPDGARLACLTMNIDEGASVDSLMFIDTARLIIERHVTVPRSSALAWHPNGDFIALALESPLLNGIRMVKADSGKPVCDLGRGVGKITQLSFSPDGHLLAVISKGESGKKPGTLTVWEWMSGTLAMKFPGDAQVASVSFLDNGNLLLTGALRSDGPLVWTVDALPSDAKAEIRTGRAGIREQLAAPAPQVWLSKVSEVCRQKALSVSDLDLVIESASLELQQEIASLVGQLDSDDFDKREFAARRLSALGYLFDPQTINKIGAGLSAEQRIRLDHIAKQHTVDPATGLIRDLSVLRAFRAIYLLERLGNPKSLEALRKLEGVTERGPIGLAAQDAKVRVELKIRRKEETREP